MSLYGLIIGLCFVLLLNYFSTHNQIIPKNKENFFFFGLALFALLGARLYHVIDQWPYYSQYPLQILNTRAGGLGILGTIIAALIYLFFVSFILHKSYIALLDQFTPILPLAQSLGRFANFFNHENPTWWHESILDFFLFILLFKYPKHPTAKYLIGYGLIRFITEFWRSDTWTINHFKVGQFLGLFFVIFGLILLKSEKNSSVTPNHHHQRPLEP